MIYGTGADVVEIARVEAALRRFGRRFAERVLGPQELQRFDARSARAAARGLAFLATRFAAKEAVAKALGLGMRQPMSWRAVEILNEASGRPIAVTHGALAAYVAARKLRLHVSVSDERAMALAYAIAETTEA
ncbi:MAG TPA: holo-ACP synthase [Burkholderiaceae bacterium]|nr:holo-ACP synthase [Burkholderiaceae bacterium]